MNNDDALARVERIRVRRLEKAGQYLTAMEDYEARALDPFEVLHMNQREFLIDLGLGAKRSHQAMLDDAEALKLVLMLAGQTFDE